MSEFDLHADDYDQAMRDPWKTWFAPDYGYFAAVKLAMLLQAARRHLGAPAGLDWLDAGCGRGELLRLGRSGFRISRGCDPSAAMLLKCGDVEAVLQPNDISLPFPSESFDMVSLCCVLHHVRCEERAGLLAEVFRVLRPQGIVVVFEHNPWNIITRWVVSRCAVDAGVSLLTPSKLRRELAVANLSPLQTRYYLFLPPRLPFAAATERVFGRLPLGGQYMMVGRRAG